MIDYEWRFLPPFCYCDFWNLYSITSCALSCPSISKNHSPLYSFCSSCLPDQGSKGTRYQVCQYLIYWFSFWLSIVYKMAKWLVVIWRWSKLEIMIGMFSLFCKGLSDSTARCGPLWQREDGQIASGSQVWSECKSTRKSLSISHRPISFLLVFWLSHSWQLGYCRYCFLTATVQNLFCETSPLFK